MKLFDRILKREPEPEQTCPRCAIPAPAAANVCAACGWDMREAFSGEPGSYLAPDRAA